MAVSDEMATALKVHGVGRDAECSNGLMLYTNRPPTDDEMRAIHDGLRDGIAALMPFVHVSAPQCEHEFKGWREFEDGRGGETVCRKCGMGAMEWTLRTGP